MTEMTDTQPTPLPPPSESITPEDRRRMITIGVVAVLILAALIAGTVALVNSGPQVTSQVRDIFIIFMALEALVIGAALVILVIQLAILINLLQTEIKPILDSTQETVSTLRGTIAFLSNNLTEPVIKLNEYLAALRKMFDLLRPGR